MTLLKIFPYDVFIAEYWSNPLLYEAQKDMECILRKERTRINLYHIGDLERLYKEVFHGQLSYDEKEMARLRDRQQGGQPFWECIKQGELYTSIEPANVMLTYRNSNEIGTCELTVQRFNKSRDGQRWGVGTLYFDKRIHIPRATLTNHYCYYGVERCLDSDKHPTLDMIIEKNKVLFQNIDLNSSEAKITRQ